jgi:RHS repeat-associated protein
LDDVPLKASYSNMNRLQSQDPGGLTRFAGTLSEPAQVSVQGKAVNVMTDNSFSGTTTLTGGTNTIQVVATDYSGNARTNTYQVTVSGSSKSFTYDNNGNLTGDGTRTVEWDAENRLTAVNNGTLRSEFTYDGVSRRVHIVEKNNGATASDTQFLWCGEEICEQRDSTGATTTARYFPQGEQQGSTNLHYTRDHLGSVRELVDTTGNIRARYDYDPYGRTTKLAGDRDSSFTYTGHYAHATSGVLLTQYRAYDPNLGRWLSQDPIGMDGGLNLYAYVSDDPIGKVDPLGLAPIKGIQGLPWCPAPTKPAADAPFVLHKLPALALTILHELQ